MILDLMPTDSAILGFGNRWYRQAFLSAELIKLPSGNQIHVLLAAFFLATKIDAFQGRGGDFFISSYIEDIVTVVDGRPEIVHEVKSALQELRSYIQKYFSANLADRNFMDTLPGYLAPDRASQARLSIVLKRI